jgi:hypothetical protein
MILPEIKLRKSKHGLGQDQMSYLFTSICRSNRSSHLCRWKRAMHRLRPRPRFWTITTVQETEMANPTKFKKRRTQKVFQKVPGTKNKSLSLNFLKSFKLKHFLRITLSKNQQILPQKSKSKLSEATESELLRVHSPNSSSNTERSGSCSSNSWRWAPSCNKCKSRFGSRWFRCRLRTLLSCSFRKISRYKWRIRQFSKLLTQIQIT